MTNPLHDLLNPPSYVLSQDDYEDLCAVRDKLLTMGQLAGTASSSGDKNAVLVIRRFLIGQLFVDLSFQMGDVLDAIAATATRGDRMQAH